ncbi:sugar-binding transcriptional regulator [Brenneria tiliae]|uniref:sugar-binding transcriptional regulator n=1 Tax=Brenneria tiliae TaxID=2914984 RepID=UPI002014F078|nr:sugar-binding transcriptional regulator [Brenneria tiliae]MCL2896099.1 sugar-binding transcriptional regulator [Brenneria tiliae]MCL2900706.1 sugar-binding transcriptional regulator [Brenneria tiliae]
MSKTDRKLDHAARAAWMYYVAGKTQHEIAELLGVSRQAAQRLVALASEHGLVRVNITHPVADCTALSQRLAHHFRLSTSLVVPSAGMDGASLNRMIAVAGAELMAQFIHRESPQVIAVGSGRALRSTINELPQIDRPQHSCVSLIGAIAADGSCTRYDVPLWMAEKTQGKYFILPAPLFADNLTDKELWCNHRIYRMVTEKAAQADVTFIGIGQMNYHCPLHYDGFITTEEVESLTAAGVTAEIVGHFIGADGQRVPSAMDDRLTSVTIRQYPEKPVIAFAGGEEKFRAIQAVLRGGWITGLVTDEDSARKLLAASARDL